MSNSSCWSGFGAWRDLPVCDSVLWSGTHINKKDELLSEGCGLLLSCPYL